MPDASGLVATPKAAPLPPGFRPSVDSGLILPEEQSRERQVWTRDEWRLLERATKMLKSHGLAVQLVCEHDACKGAALEPRRLRDGSFRLRCPHADRVLVKHF